MKVVCRERGSKIMIENIGSEELKLMGGTIDDLYKATESPLPSEFAILTRNSS